MHYLLNQGQKNVYIWISHSSHSCIFCELLVIYIYIYTHNLLQNRVNDVRYLFYITKFYNTPPFDVLQWFIILNFDY